MHQRSERIAELIRQEISLLLSKLKDPGLAGLLTVTDLKLTRDRKSAVVFYSLLGSEEQRKSTAKALERSTPYLRMQLRERTSLKAVPSLQFEFDHTPERAQRIEDIIHKLEEERAEGG